jgi:probable HAF family extracellular repeat protein
VIDPLTGHPETDAVLYRDGQIINLGTFGGNQSFGLAINDRRKVQLVGWALNTIPDPIYPWGYFGTQMRAFLWTTDGGLQDLGTLGGPDSLAELVNNHGQIAGQAFTNSIINHKTGMPTLDPFFWEDNKMVDMGTLGGTVGNSLGFNNKGQIVGESNLKGDVVFHPFFWEKGLKNLKDLGTLGGSYGAALWINDAGDAVGWANTTNSGIDHAVLWKNGKKRKGTDLGIVNGYGYSFAYSINSMRQIVGCGANNNYTCSAAFLWEDGQMVDLNTLVAGGSGLHLFEAVDINDRGEIAGNGALQNGDVHAFLLIPCKGGTQGCKLVTPSSAALPEDITQSPTAMTQNSPLRSDGMGALRSRFGRRYQHGGFGTHQPN